MTVPALRESASEYMEWAKTRADATFNLAVSGVAPVSLAELGATLADLELTGPSAYGWPPLQQQLARRLDVPAECLVAAGGTSLANFIVMSLCLGKGDEVVIEEPTYPLLVDMAHHLGAVVKRFARRAADHYAIDPAAVRAALSPRTRLVALTNLHNPTSVRSDDAVLTEVGRLAASVGARVLVDEVYLEALYSDPLPSAFRLGPAFIATSSLTKAFGLSGLRCGYILAAPEIALRAHRMHDVMVNVPAHPAERLSLVALNRLGQLRLRAQGLLEPNRAAFDTFVALRRDLQDASPRAGTVRFPRLRGGSVDDFARLLRERHETSVVPGRFFGAADGFRVGLGIDPGTFREGLRRIGLALDEFGR